MTLKKPVYTPKSGSIFFNKHKEAMSTKRKFQNTLDEFTLNNPSLKYIGIFSSSKIGIYYHSDSVKEFESELKVKPERGYRIFKKNSKTLKRIQKEMGNEIEHNSNIQNAYRFLISEYFDFAMSNQFNSQTINNKLYFSAGELSIESDDIELVPYHEYLDILAKKHAEFEEKEVAE